MLRALHVRDFVIVEQTDLEFDAGFTVFSGETGAGKSILIDALALALGERADAGSIREGAERADISAEFDTPDSAHDWLDAQGHEREPTLLLRRTIDRQGRSRAFINGTPATASQLRELSDLLIDIHGQHAHQRLLRTDAQRDMLDAHGQLQPQVLAVQQAWQHWQALQARLDTLERDAGALAQEQEQLQWQIDELDALALQPDEWTALQTEQQRLAHAQTLIEGITHALAALDQDDMAIHSQLASIVQRIGHLVRHDARLEPIRETLESARIAVAESVSDLNGYQDRLELDPGRLAEAEARMGRIFDLARKYRVEPDDLPKLLEELQGRLDDLGQAQDIEALRTQVQSARDSYDRLAQALSAARRKAADDLGKQVTRAMQTLAMSGSRFDVALEPAKPGPHGLESTVFQIAANQGSSTRPLHKVASGGELARISLALSVIASRAAQVPTLIFDEVDSGIGGAVAEVVGRLLRELGGRHQVLCVTHLPQVAACGHAHYLVGKARRSGTVRSTITPLDAPARVEEIARMLGGIDITATTRQHAQEMLTRVF